jgi:hypothetical protein
MLGTPRRLLRALAAGAPVEPDGGDGGGVENGETVIAWVLGAAVLVDSDQA